MVAIGGITLQTIINFLEPMIKPRLPFVFILLVFILSIPLWILGAFLPDTTKIFPIKLPFSALMTFCPMLAASILIHKNEKMEGVKSLFKTTLDFNKNTNWKWYIPIVLLMPFIALLSFWYAKATGEDLTKPPLAPFTIFLFFILYVIGAIGEELGWSGYATNPLQEKYGAFKASVIIGVIWAVWHIIPYYQMHQTTNWIIWQCLGTVFLRIIMVWIFNHSGKSVFGMILFHTMINISPYLIPHYGNHYDPFIFCILLMITTGIIFILNGNTLERNK
jgi:membrane protease YdiL (CAAX protease family)